MEEGNLISINGVGEFYMLKIKFVDVHWEFDKKSNFITDIIERNFEGYEFSDSPDFLFFSCEGTEHYKYDNCVKIFFTGEPVTPDFNQCDYAIGYDELEFGERYCKKPYWQNRMKPSTTTKSDEELLNRKFCNFIYSNETRGTSVELRKKFALELMKYKNVDCPGKVLNNMKDAIASRHDNWEEAKIRFIEDYKFTIAFENNKMLGYTTEKLEDPLYAHSVPIYWGNPNVGNEFNSQAFVYCDGGEENFEEVIEEIIYLDTHDEEYLKMIRTPCMNENYNVEKEKEKLEKFIVDILNRGNVPFEKDALGFAKKMSIPDLSTSELVKRLFWKMKYHLRKKR